MKKKQISRFIIKSSIMMLLGFYLFVSQAVATPIINNTGLISPGQTINFSEVILLTETPVTTQFASFGVTFSPQLFYNVQPIFFPTESLASFMMTEETLNNVSLLFSYDVSAAAIALQSNPSTTTFTALNNGTVIETFSTFTELSNLPDLSHANDFYGFEGIIFDELRIENEYQTFQVDNLQFTQAAAVPEPSTMLLLGSGLLGVVALRKKIKKS